MNKFLKMVQLATVFGATSTVALSVGLAKQENNSIINLEKNNYQDWRIERLPDLKSWAEDMIIFNNELYLAMARGELAKIDSAGKITYLMEGNNKKFTSINEFNNCLYISNNRGEIFKVDKQNNIVVLKEKFDSWIMTMTQFNGYLYIALNSGRVYKMDKNEKITFVDLDISYVSFVRRMVVFNNHLYFGRMDGQVFKIDQNENLTKIIKVSSITAIMTMKVFNNELYFGTSPEGKLFKLDKEDKITNITLTKITILTLEVFRNELYIGMWDSYLWKLNSQGQLEKVAYVADDYFRTMHAFNGELYISHDVYEFAKLTNK